MKINKRIVMTMERCDSISQKLNALSASQTDICEEIHRQQFGVCSMCLTLNIFEHVQVDL